MRRVEEAENPLQERADVMVALSHNGLLMNKLAAFALRVLEHAPLPERTALYAEFHEAYRESTRDFVRAYELGRTEEMAKAISRANKLRESRDSG